ncbi:hypothetical protein ABC418_09005 [Lactiplantibacillus plantarum]|uniref:hypothetical protein n=1 Tax=Lactiplantibacillus plantarum TaxID=1590 RepID=UPI003965A942
MSKIKLLRLVSPIEDDHRVLYENYQQIVGYIQKTFDILVNQGWIDKKALQVIDDYRSNEFNQSYFHWRKAIIIDLNQIVNLAEIKFNLNGLLTPPDYHLMEPITLWLPRKLIFNMSYKNKMNQNYLVLEETINGLYDALNDAKIIQEK